MFPVSIGLQRGFHVKRLLKLEQMLAVRHMGHEIFRFLPTQETVA